MNRLLAGGCGGAADDPADTLRRRCSGCRSRAYRFVMAQLVVSRDPDVMGGAPVFAGTRVPVQTLLDYLEAGESIDDFLRGFPTVSRTQVIAFPDQATDRLVATVS